MPPSRFDVDIKLSEAVQTAALAPNATEDDAWPRNSWSYGGQGSHLPASVDFDLNVQLPPGNASFTAPSARQRLLPANIIMSRLQRIMLRHNVYPRCPFQV